MIKRQHKNVKCVWKNIKKETRFLCAQLVFLCIQKAATHNVTRWNITEDMP